MKTYSTHPEGNFLGRAYSIYCPISLVKGIKKETANDMYFVLIDVDILCSNIFKTYCILFSVTICKEEQDLCCLPSPLEIVVQASQQTHYFPQDDGVGQIKKSKGTNIPFSSFLNMISSYNEA